AASDQLLDRGVGESGAEQLATGALRRPLREVRMVEQPRQHRLVRPTGRGHRAAVVEAPTGQAPDRVVDQGVAGPGVEREEPLRATRPVATRGPGRFHGRGPGRVRWCGPVWVPGTGPVWGHGPGPVSVPGPGLGWVPGPGLGWVPGRSLGR